jgi:hypothetical protein
MAQKLWEKCKLPLQIACQVAILGQLVGLPPNYSEYSSSESKLIQSALTNHYLQLLEQSSSNVLERTQILKLLASMSQYISPIHSQCRTILRTFTTQFYLLRKSTSLVVPHSPPAALTSHLQELSSSHSFANYGTPVSSLLEAFDFECERGFIDKMPFAQTSLINVGLLRDILRNLEESSANILLELLLEGVSMEEEQYMVDMSLTKFCQLTTNILMIYWLMSRKGFQLRADLAFGLFQILSGSHALRMLEAGFWEEEALIGLILLICQSCYTAILGADPQTKEGSLSEVRKLKLKLTLLECAINNTYEQSFIIRVACYYILLIEAAPVTIGESLHNLHSTLISRNVYNLQFILSLAKLCNL